MRFFFVFLSIAAKNFLCRFPQITVVHVIGRVDYVDKLCLHLFYEGWPSSSNLTTKLRKTKFILFTLISFLFLWSCSHKSN